MSPHLLQALLSSASRVCVCVCRGREGGGGAWPCVCVGGGLYVQLCGRCACVSPLPSSSAVVLHVSSDHPPTTSTTEHNTNSQYCSNCQHYVKYHSQSQYRSKHKSQFHSKPPYYCAHCEYMYTNAIATQDKSAIRV